MDKNSINTNLYKKYIDDDKDYKNKKKTVLYLTFLTGSLSCVYQFYNLSNSSNIKLNSMSLNYKLLVCLATVIVSSSFSYLAFKNIYDV